ncbi:MAG: PTS sugar transporter subunit IIA [Phycisphaerales bacterium]|nr:MAG: PTS sugar transporter subunit IIA [Phycisphaerales bacterium]
MTPGVDEPGKSRQPTATSGRSVWYDVTSAPVCGGVSKGSRSGRLIVLNLLDILSLKSIKVPLASTEKKAVVYELIDLLAEAKLISDAEKIKTVVWEREQQRTTGIGEGLAIPHGKSPAASGLVMAIGRPTEPIDFDAIDKRPVRLVVLLVSPPEKTADHIQALGRISRMMSDPKTRLAAYNAESAEELYKLFEQAEQSTGAPMA